MVFYDLFLEMAPSISFVTLRRLRASFQRSRNACGLHRSVMNVRSNGTGLYSRSSYKADRLMYLAFCEGQKEQLHLTHVAINTQQSLPSGFLGMEQGHIRLLMRSSVTLKSADTARRHTSKSATFAKMILCRTPKSIPVRYFSAVRRRSALGRPSGLTPS
jgi:hypothetical protein